MATYYEEEEEKKSSILGTPETTQEDMQQAETTTGPEIKTTTQGELPEFSLTQGALGGTQTQEAEPTGYQTQQQSKQALTRAAGSQPFMKPEAMKAAEQQLAGEKSELQKEADAYTSQTGSPWASASGAGSRQEALGSVLQKGAAAPHYERLKLMLSPGQVDQPTLSGAELGKTQTVSTPEALAKSYMQSAPTFTPGMAQFEAARTWENPEFQKSLEALETGGKELIGDIGARGGELKSAREQEQASESQLLYDSLRQGLNDILAGIVERAPAGYSAADFATEEEAQLINDIGGLLGDQAFTRTDRIMQDAAKSLEDWGQQAAQGPAVAPAPEAPPPLNVGDYVEPPQAGAPTGGGGGKSTLADISPPLGGAIETLDRITTPPSIDWNWRPVLTGAMEGVGKASEWISPRWRPFEGLRGAFESGVGSIGTPEGRPIDTGALGELGRAAEEQARGTPIVGDIIREGENLFPSTMEGFAKEYERSGLKNLFRR